MARIGDKIFWNLQQIFQNVQIQTLLDFILIALRVNLNLEGSAGKLKNLNLLLQRCTFSYVMSNHGVAIEIIFVKFC